MGNYTLVSSPNPAALAQQAAVQWLARLTAAPDSSPPFTVALSGGRIARDFFRAAADLARSNPSRLQRVHFFWGDERCVPPNDPESNFAVANELLLQPLQIPSAQIHRIPGEMPEAEQAAKVAAEDLLRITPRNSAGLPIIDLILLGMGEDGHTASLFPDESPDAAGSSAIFRAVIGPKPPPRRVTLGYQAIAAAREAWVLVSGRDKEPALHDSLTGRQTTPLGRVVRERMHTIIFTDLV